MKKVLLIMFFVITSCVCLTACGPSVERLVKENLSEVTKVYFYGECEDFYCSLASGSREVAYLMDGKSGGCVDFALLSINFNDLRSQQILKAVVSINNKSQEVELEKNPLNNAYMFDFEKKLKGDEEIFVEVSGKSIKILPISNDFLIDYEKALKIAAKNLKKQIMLKKKFGNLNAECYLRILDKKANNFDKMFWCFTVLNVDNQSFSIVISTEDGSVLAKS